MIAGGRVVLVATPIGNLGDLSPRAVSVMAEADVVYCEDTRRTRALLAHAGVTGVGLMSLHAHNEQARIPQLLARLAAGETVAVVSDAGMPSVSDPGARLVVAALGAGASVSVVPGPNAALGALVVSGLDSERYCFEGFLPRRGPERRLRIGVLAADARTSVLYEAPSRVASTLADLAVAAGADRPVAVVRELTKVHEEVWRGSLSAAAAAFAAREVLGEVVIVMAGAPPRAPAPDSELAEALAAQVAAGDSLRDAATTVARRFGVPRRRVYALALSVRDAGGAEAADVTDVADGPSMGSA
ncbi:MAG TPA: 16S rRNA (cytidine(1402)-2'-O)-methyltransferase [Acidimicrobiales bacterium]|nr:16S rRNA (cytidine(1402)-2'-O)-methyltransferase [Acidimicrobiales bacterium]